MCANTSSILTIFCILNENTANTNIEIASESNILFDENYLNNVEMAISNVCLRSNSATRQVFLGQKLMENAISTVRSKSVTRHVDN